MAVPAPKGPQRDSLGKFQSPEVVLTADNVKEMAAKLYGLGFKRPQVAQAMAHVLTADGNVKVARRRLARFEQEQEFRDLIWKHAVVKLDLETPAILKGVASQAKRGRVDAAKLALAVADRYSDKSEQPHEVTIHLAELPRPTSSTTDKDSELSGREILPPPK
jgi:hypothetical protein